MSAETYNTPAGPVPIKVVICDIVSLAKAQLKISIWEDVKNGNIIQKNTTYIAEERIQYWTANRDKYLNELKSYATIEIIRATLELIPTEFVNILKLFFGL